MLKVDLCYLEEVVNKNLNSIREVVEDKVTLKWVKVYWHEEDGNGCNWNVKYVCNKEYKGEIELVINELRKKYRLDK